MKTTTTAGLGGRATMSLVPGAGELTQTHHQTEPDHQRQEVEEDAPDVGCGTEIVDCLAYPRVVK